jgi:hypothetical protein
MTSFGEHVRLVDMVEDGNAVTVVVDHPDSELAQVHVLEGEDCSRERMDRIIHDNPEAAILGYFGMRAVIEPLPANP